MAIAQATQDTLDVFEAKYKWAIILGLALQLFVDLVNTTSLCAYLQIERTGFRRYVPSVRDYSSSYLIYMHVQHGWNIEQAIHMDNPYVISAPRSFDFL